MVNQAMVDSHHRTMKKLRVSLTEVCNYACFYCMPEKMNAAPKNNLLPPAELYRIVSQLVLMGIQELRITGGEPTMRPEFTKIMSLLGSIEAANLNLTTNGQMIYRHLDFLKECNLKNINFSLDSLDPGRFEVITRGGSLHKVLKAVYKSKELGIHTKINCVALKGINDNEFIEFIEWGQKHDIEVRFLELMKIGPMVTQNARHFISAAEIREILRSYDLENKLAPIDSTAKLYQTNRQSNLGIIGSETEPFCGNCSRLRLSATGTLRPCLMLNDGVNIKNLAPHLYPSTIQDLLKLKPTGRIESVPQAMHQIGG